MFFSLLAAAFLGIAGCNQLPPPKSADDVDQTERLMGEFEETYTLVSEGSFASDECTLNLWTTERARSNMDNYEGFDKNWFNGEVIDAFEKNISYYNSFAPHPVDDVHLIVVDFADDKGSMSQTTHLHGKPTRIIWLDIDRWYKVFKGSRKFLKNVSAIHEYAHVQNYTLDSDEEKRTRELTAIMFESLHLIHNYSYDLYGGNYLKKLGIEEKGKVLVTKEDIFTDKYCGNDVLRLLAHRLIVDTYEGKYTWEGETSAEDKIKEFSSLLIAEKKNGEEGFNQAIKDAGIMLGDSHLTLDDIQQHAYDALISEGKL